MSAANFTHFDAEGNAVMVDVSAKTETTRSATAKGRVLMARETAQLIQKGGFKKGDVLGIARLAGIMGAKKTPDLIPLCHPLMLSSVKVELSLAGDLGTEDVSAVEIEATCKLRGQTGVEMEALTAVSIAALTIYDMCKAVDKKMTLTDIRLIDKTGGKSGDFHRDEIREAPPMPQDSFAPRNIASRNGEAPLTTFDEALKILCHEMPAVKTEKISIYDAFGRFLATPIRARLSHPRCDVSAMDGYAVRQKDLKDLPCEMVVVSESKAGGSQKKLGSREALRVFTGAPLPQGADTIITQENTEPLQDGENVRILNSCPKGKFIRPKGLDFHEGETALTVGRGLNERDIALAVAMGYSSLEVYRKPRVAIIGNGDEIKLPGESLGPNQIYSSNTVALTALVKSYGCDGSFLGVAKDNRESFEELLQMALSEYDCLITTGGASVGKYDLVRRLLESDLNHTVFFNKLAVRPGKPVIFAKLNGHLPLLALPGNPVSTLVAARSLVRVALAKLCGAMNPELNFEEAEVTCDLPENDNRMDFLRSHLERTVENNWQVTPFDKQDSSMLKSLQKSDALIIRKAFAPATPAGTKVTVLRLDQ